MEGPSSKYVPTNSTISGHNLAIQFLHSLKHLTPKQSAIYGRFIAGLLAKFDFIEQPLQHVHLPPFIEACINEILIKEKPDKTFQEEIDWISLIQRHIQNEQLFRYENTHLLLNNLNKILQYQNMDDITYPQKIQEHVDKLNAFNLIFDKSYHDNLDPVDVIINIDALNESIKNF